MPDHHPTATGDLRQTGPPIPELIGTGPAAREVYALARRVAPSNAAVLLVGETGTGKGLLARAIHRLGPRGGGPFVQVNCAGLTERLLESELFGHLRGSFAGAIDDRAGQFEAARTGTLLLEEVDSVPARLQVKLLRTLQQHEFQRIGDTRATRVDTRVIAATSRDLWEEVEAGRFREDLYYRLAVITICVPPLRQRGEDIAELVTHFLKIYSRQNNRHVLHPQQEALDALHAYHWPGNVRELQNYIQRAVVLASGDQLTCDLLPEVVRGGKLRRLGHHRRADLDTLASELVDQGIATAGARADSLHAAIVNRVERELIVQVMAACEGVQTKAAARLGISRNTLHKKLREHGLEK